MRVEAGVFQTLYSARLWTTLGKNFSDFFAKRGRDEEKLDAAHIDMHFLLSGGRCIEKVASPILFLQSLFPVDFLATFDPVVGKYRNFIS